MVKFQRVVSKAAKAGSKVGKVVRAKSNELKFKGGTPLEFNAFIPMFLAHLESKCCRELIEGEGPEDIFDIPRPCEKYMEDEYVQDQIDAQINELNNTLAMNLQMVQDAGLNAAQTAQRVLDLRLAKNNKVTEVQNSKGKLLMEINKQVTDWEKQQQNFQEKVGNCKNAFYEYFGKAVLAVCSSFLKAGQVRAAWNCLLKSFNSSVGGQEGIHNIMIQLNDFNSADFPTISEAIEHCRSLADECNTGDTPLEFPDQLLLEMFLSGVEKSGNKDFADIVKDIRKDKERTFEKAGQLFYERETTLRVKNQTKSKSTSSNAAANEAASEELYNMFCHFASTGKFKGKFGKKAFKSTSKLNGKANVVCKVCNKPGHTDENCWTKKTCEVCKQVGHIGKYCPTKKRNPKGSDFSVRNYAK
jgi:hypothetical protein